jgi:hypothetical protein
MSNACSTYTTSSAISGLSSGPNWTAGTCSLKKIRQLREEPLLLQAAQGPKEDQQGGPDQLQKVIEGVQAQYPLQNR